MRIVCDEGIERQIVARLREEGHRVDYVAEMDPGLPDKEVLAFCREHQALLITNDKDFGELVFRNKEAHHGVMLLRLAGATPPNKAKTVAAVVEQHGSRLRGPFSVVEVTRVRVRGKPTD